MSGEPTYTRVTAVDCAGDKGEIEILSYRCCGGTSRQCRNDTIITKKEGQIHSNVQGGVPSLAGRPGLVGYYHQKCGE